MSTRGARARRALPRVIPALLVVLIEVVVVVLAVAWVRSQQHALCSQLQHARATSNTTLRHPFRQLALDAAAAREASAKNDDHGNPVQRRIDEKAAASYRKVATRVRDLPPLKC